MDSELLALVKIWGPLALGWPIAFMLGRELLSWVKEEREKMKVDVESRLKLAASLDNLTKIIVERLSNAKP